MTTEIKDLREGLEAKLAEGFAGLQKKYDAVIDGQEKGEKATNELKTQIENQKGEIERVIEQVQKLEEKGVQLRGAGAEKKGFIDLIQGNDAYKALLTKSQPSANIEVSKDDMARMEETKVTSAGLTIPTYDPTIQDAPRQELRIRSLIPTTPTSGTSFTYFREDEFTSGAGMVPEGGLKPEANVTFTQVTDTVKKIAVWMRVTDEALADVPQLQSYIRDLLRYDLKLAEEAQILKGDGAGNNLNGIMTQATAFDAALARAGDTAIDTVRRAIYQVRRQSKRGADAVVMSELDWMNIELQKDGENRYLFANLQGLVTPVLWGRPVVVSDSMDEGGADAGGEFLVGAFQAGARIYDRMAFTFKMGWVNDDFIKNQQVLLVEERLGLAVRRPYAFVKGTFGA